MTILFRVCNKNSSDKSAEILCPPIECHGCKSRDCKLAEIQVEGLRSPSVQSRPLSLWLRYFWSPKNGSEGQTIHLGRRRQSVCAELVHNVAPGILRDSHSPPCVAVGQVPQQPGPIHLKHAVRSTDIIDVWSRWRESTKGRIQTQFFNKMIGRSKKACNMSRYSDKIR